MLNARSAIEPWVGVMTRKRVRAASKSPKPATEPAPPRSRNGWLRSRSQTRTLVPSSGCCPVTFCAHRKSAGKVVGVIFRWCTRARPGERGAFIVGAAVPPQAATCGEALSARGNQRPLDDQTQGGAAPLVVGAVLQS